MKTSQTIVNNILNESIFPLKVSSLRQDRWYFGITSLIQNTHFTCKILQCTSFICIYYTYSYQKWVWDVSLKNEISDFQYARFHIYWLCISIYDCFGQLLSPLWYPDGLHLMVLNQQNLLMTYKTCLEYKRLYRGCIIVFMPQAGDMTFNISLKVTTLRVSLLVLYRLFICCNCIRHHGQLLYWEIR